MPTTTVRPTRRITRLAVIGAILASVGIGAVQASPVSAAPAPATTAHAATAVRSSNGALLADAAAPAEATARPTAAPAAAAASWNFVGVFPDPLSCTIAGIATGLPFFCGWYVLFWGLNVLY